jgi:cytochrome c peroxidase
LDPETLSRALASFVRSILSGNSRFDQFINGQRDALSDEEQHGLQIFRGKGNCTACHVGPNFSDEKLHNTGVAWKPPPGPEQRGHYTDTGGGHGDFKTPTLREVSRTAPYMHDGSFASLEAVVDFYDGGGRPNADLDPEIHPLYLTIAEKRALVTFLGSLTDAGRPRFR